VRPASLREDVLRRDFTVNTLVENIHHGGVQDLTGMALADLASRTIRTPLDPSSTFADDPLRMLRAIRFAATLGFAIEPGTWAGIAAQAARIDLVSGGGRVVSAERIRDEFERIILSPDPSAGMGLLLDSGLLARFLPELQAMKGVAQNAWHAMDVWDHTMEALRQLPGDAALSMRLGLLFHDVGKPVTRTEDDRGVHFYGHENVGADMTRRALHRLRMPADLIREVGDLVALHMRLGQVRPEWTPPALRRLVRDMGPHLEALHQLAAADIAAMGGDAHPPDLEDVMARIAATNAEMNATEVESPLDGRAIMRVLGVPPGAIVGRAKEHLVNEIIEGRLQPGDAAAAEELVRAWMARGIGE
jgi:poly(A) polymerase